MTRPRFPRLSWRKVAETAAGAVDHLALQALHLGRGATARDMPHEARMRALEAIATAYEGAGDAFFTDPETPSVRVEEVTSRIRLPRGARVLDARWSSDRAPYLRALTDKVRARVENATAHARVFLGPGAGGRAAVIAVHGYLGGYYVMEQSLWPIGELIARGLDVALPVLPHHGLRASGRVAPPFPSADPRFTNEGFRQAVLDILVLARWLRARGAPAVGVMGISLGGYTSALLGTLPGAVDFVIPMMPLASVADFAHRRGHLGEGEEAELERDALERANWIASPFARPPQVPPSRTLVIAAQGDLVTPPSHAEQLARHFGCEVVTVSGGHVVQLGLRSAFRRVLEMLDAAGIARPARG